MSSKYEELAGRRSQCLTQLEKHGKVIHALECANGVPLLAGGFGQLFSSPDLLVVPEKLMREFDALLEKCHDHYFAELQSVEARLNAIEALLSEEQTK